MSTVLEVIEQNGISIGEQRGISIGEQRGIAIGEQRGIAIGEQRGEQRVNETVIRKLLGRNWEPSEIAQFMDTTIEHVLEVKRKM